MKNKVTQQILLPLILIMSAFVSNGQNIEQEKLITTLGIINSFYVDSVDEKKVVEHGIRKMLEHLDPHSTFIPAKEVEKTNEPLVGSFEGVGIQFNILKDTILVVSPIVGGPSESVGIMAGDKIVRIDTSIVAGIGIKNSDVIKQLRGTKGTKVEVGIKRRGEKELIDFTITRDKIPLYSVDASYMVSPEIGYIKISRFAAKTAEEFRTAVKELKMEGMKDLIVDLQGNSGGYLRTAAQITDELLSDQKDMVYTQGRANPKRMFKSTSRGMFEDGRLVVLINEGSASASEIVSGAVQDWDRGVIVGRRSFGKGLVQKPYKLPDGSMIRLTIAKYYTPSGRCIQRPYEEGKKAYNKEFQRRLNSGELMGLDTIEIADSLIYFTNNKRKVYGAGGIMPDMFIPLDTSENSDYYSKLFRKGLLNRFVLNHMDRERDQLLAIYPSVNEFDANFEISDKLIKEFVEFAEKEKVEKDADGLKRSIRPMKIQLKALMARNLWDSSAYFQVLNKELNDIFKAGVDLLSKGDYNAQLVAED